MRLSNLLDFIYPPSCHACGCALGPGERYICRSCLAALPRTMYHLSPDNLMAARFAGVFPYVRASSHFFYSRDSVLASLIHDFKYRHFPGIAVRLGEIMGGELAVAGFLSDIDAIAPVPMHVVKRARRGYNQTEQIARGLSEVSGIPVISSLRASRPHKTQTSKSLAQRRDNVSGVFSVKNPLSLAGRHILLLDDVCTTGATLTAAAETLLRAVEEVSGVGGQSAATLVRGYDPADPKLRISLLTLGATF